MVRLVQVERTAANAANKKEGYRHGEVLEC